VSFRIRSTSAVLSVGSTNFSIAAAPATSGAEPLVPDCRVTNGLPGIGPTWRFAPCAQMSTDEPKFELLQATSPSSAPTVTVPGVRVAGRTS
jgi:hypothetical protein